MSQADVDRVKRIYHEVAEAAESERAQLLHTLCGDDESLRAQVESLLAADEAGSDILDSREIEDTHAVHAMAPAGPENTIEAPGSRIGPYKLLQVIGEGGFGVVYMAEQETPIRRRVAFKVVKPGMDTKQVIARFEAERQALAIMDHPNIAKVFEAGTTPTGRPYFVMELVRGIPITEYCDEHRLDTRERLKLFAEVCSAVHHAHQHGIIHRDIKPSNVMVTLHDGTPVPKIIDFGIAKATHQRLTERTLFTEFNQFIGTPAYMSPEQAAYEGLDVDGRSDVYSLGVLLYELLTGTTPFDAAVMKRAAYLEVLRILKEDDPPKPSTRISTMGKASMTNAKARRLDPVGLVRLLRGDLDWIVMKALEKDRSRRYRSATDMAEDINRFFNHQPILARRPSRIYRARKLARRRRIPILAAAAAAALGVEIGRENWQRFQEPVAVPDGAVAPAPDADQAARLLLSDSDGCLVWSGLNPSPDGTRVVHTNMCSGGALVLRNLASGDTTVLAADAIYSSPVWSPDGNRIAAVIFRRVNGGQLRILDAGTGADVTPDAMAGMRLTPRSWAGSHIAGLLADTEGRSAIVVVSLTTGRVVRLANAVNQGNYPSLSPDGRYVAFTDYVDGNQNIYVASVEGTGRRRITSGPERDASPLWSPDGDVLIYQNPNGLLAIPMTDGTPSGAAYGVRKESLVPIAWRRNGLYYAVENYVSEPYQLPVDPLTGRASGAEERLPEALVWSPRSERGSGEGAVQWMAWSPDMSRLTMAIWDGVMRIYTPANGSVAEFPMGGEFMPSLLWWSADGREILFTTAPQVRRDRRATVFALNPDDGGVRELFPRLDSVYHVIHLSPDGRRMTFITNLTGPGPKELRVTDTGSPRGIVLASAPGPEGYFSTRAGQPVFSPDGSNVLFLRAQGGGRENYRSSIWIAPADGETPPRMLVSSTGGFFPNRFWSPDGRMVAFTEVDMSTWRASVAVLSVDSGERHELLSFDYASAMAEQEVDLKYWSPDGRYLGITRTTGQNEYWVVTDLLGQNEPGGGG